MYKVVDLFSGAGGLSLGFEQTGEFEVIVAIEKDPAAQLTYKINNKSNVTILDDILNITDFEDFRLSFGQIDVVIGGPPCQGFSNANRQKFDLISQNNILVKKYIEFVEKLYPKAFVMENVAMLKSDVHRFYITKNDNIENLKECLLNEKIYLYQGDFELGLEELRRMGEKEDIQQYLIEDRLLKDLVLLQKKTNNKDKLKKIIDKRGNQYLKDLKSTIESFTCDSLYYTSYVQKSLQAFINIISNEHINEVDLIAIKEFIRVQRFFCVAQELKNNLIRFEGIKLVNNRLEVSIKAITVFNYLVKKLEKNYQIDTDVLNAAWYGAPQKRKRFIALGIRKDLIKENDIDVCLPKKIFKEENYRTVEDAIADLVAENPQYETDLPAIHLEKLEGSKELIKVLRDSEYLHNHIITQTREHILKRFEQLKPGQNFHDLDKSIIDTYADPSRTQNSIYKRLDFKEPSPTVTNVRKSMWIHPTINRAISVREAARLQTFPDSFIFKGTKDAQYQQVGNAVPPIMAKAIALKLLKLLNGIQ